MFNRVSGGDYNKLDMQFTVRVTQNFQNSKFLWQKYNKNPAAIKKNEITYETVIKNQASHHAYLHKINISNH